jgi:flagellar assembly protein FliH
MMISPSEGYGKRVVAAGAPVRLLGEGIREVSRLEFYPLAVPEIQIEVEQTSDAALLREEVATLGGRLRSQEEEISAAMESARAEARAEASSDYGRELAERIAVERAAILRVCEEFREERKRYFAGVEAEVVKLALAIAARVLHREVNLDPLLLTGVVRVALEKVAEDSVTVLRVPGAAIEKWRQVFAESQGPSPQIVGDQRLGASDCVLETNVGRVELGVKAQLEEIERGFFDLMQQRPA